MNEKMTSLFAGIALLASVGMANAEERLSAASMDNVTAGFSFDGNVAESLAIAACSGDDCAAGTLAVAVTDDDGALAVAAAFSGTD